MTQYFGDFAEDATVYIPFNTFSSDDPSASVTITNLADADIKVHKDGSATQIVTDGATVSIDFDSITGNHLITIDTSAHADYSTGSDYMVRMEGTTIDGATVNAWIGSFSIENRFMRGTDSANTTTPPTASAIADAVLDEALSGHTTAGTLGQTITEIEEDVTGLNGDAMRGTDGAYTGTPPAASAIADAVLDEALSGHTTAGTLGQTITEIEEDVTGLNGDAMRGTDGANTTTPLDAAGTRAAVGLATANLDTQLGAIPTSNPSVSDILTTQMTEAYAADGTAPTLAQALFLIQQTLTEFGISGTTKTVRRLDGSTVAATFTLDDDTNPSDLTRAT